MAALSPGPLLTTASKDLASQVFRLFTVCCNKEPEIGSPVSWPRVLTGGLVLTKVAVPSSQAALAVLC